MGLGPIVVIADDLSGAAELVGIAFASGHSAEVQRQRFDPASAAAVIAVDTDSRGLAPEVAADRVRTAAQAILAAKPAWIFKKVDSLLRGNVRAEIEALLKVTKHKRAVLIPSNPSRGRTIERGEYLISGTPLDQTELARDPEHPRRSAAASELLGGGKMPLHLVPSRVEWPRRGIVIPDSIDHMNRLHGLTMGCNAATLPVGAADFFTTFLIQHGGKKGTPREPTEKLGVTLPVLMVCGSRAAWEPRAAECVAAGVPVRTFAPVFEGERLPEVETATWADRAASQLASAGRLLLGVGLVESAARPADLVDRLAHLTALVLERTPVKTLLLEGGATAEAVASRMGWIRLAASEAAPSGIGILQPLNVAVAPRVWIKPGSYPWPDAVWRALQ